MASRKRSYYARDNAEKTSSKSKRRKLVSEKQTQTPESFPSYSHHKRTTHRHYISHNSHNNHSHHHKRHRRHNSDSDNSEEGSSCSDSADVPTPNLYWPSLAPITPTQHTTTHFLSSPFYTPLPLQPWQRIQYSPEHSFTQPTFIQQGGGWNGTNPPTEPEIIIISDDENDKLKKPPTSTSSTTISHFPLHSPPLQRASWRDDMFREKFEHLIGSSKPLG